MLPYDFMVGANLLTITNTIVMTVISSNLTRVSFGAADIVSSADHVCSYFVVIRVDC